MSAALKFLSMILGFFNPIKKESRGSNLPAALKVSWLKIGIIVLFIGTSGYLIFGSDAPIEERKAQLEMIEELAEDAVEILDGN